ncbi:MAG TPA: CDP-alcohol phosphatidyltransferase family protein [Candidatus Binatia bacterium]|nr:CDP-alcohol phosphatidyltransferase family protein [Candidatus Binatia bacterium]
MNADGKYALILTLVILSIAAAYVLRLVVKGRARFDRTERQGGSWLLGKGIMELGYWGFLPAARLLVSLQISPNQVSWASLAFGFAAGACLSVGHFGFAAVCAALSSILDCLDGMVARIANAASEPGELLDATVDRYAEFFFLAGLIIYYRAHPALQLLALFALLGSFMVSYSSAKAEALNAEPPRGNMRRPERAVYLGGGAMLSAITMPWLESPRDGAIAIGYPMVVALAVVAVAANISAVERFWSIARTLRAREKPAAKTIAEASEEAAIEAPEPRRSAGMGHSR